MTTPPSLHPLTDPYSPPDGPPAIVYHDAHMVVADKPAGLLSVPGRGEGKHDCLISRVQQVFADALTVHRLDMETSGLIVFARTREVHRTLSYAFQSRQVRKEYVAVVSGLVAEDEGQIELPLICDWPRRPLQKVDHEQGKPSTTRYRVLTRHAARATTRVALEPLTGRSHQLRVHMQALGHPILGDALYADAAARAAAPRLLLHASALRLAHPVDGHTLDFTCPPEF